MDLGWFPAKVVGLASFLDDWRYHPKHALNSKLLHIPEIANPFLANSLPSNAPIGPQKTLRIILTKGKSQEPNPKKV